MKKMRIIVASLLILVIGFGLGLLAHRDSETEPAVVLNGFGSESIEMLTSLAGMLDEGGAV